MPTNKKKHFLSHRNRLNSKYRSNPESILDYEFIELILGYEIKGRDVKLEAKELLAFFDNDLWKLVKYAYNNESIDVKGVGPKSLSLLSMFFDLNKRVSKQKLQNQKPISLTNVEVTVEFIRTHLESFTQEVFLIVTLNPNREYISHKVLFTGSSTEVSIDSKEIVKYAVIKGASYVIFAHNHLSHNTNPSKSDIYATNNIIEGLKIFDIELSDHIIVSTQQDGYFSFAEHGILK